MSDAQASAHSLKQTQSLVCFLLHLNVFNNVLKPQCWNSQIQRRWKQITSSHRCTSAKYLTWYIAPRCYWDQRPHEYSNEMFNLCWRDYWKATEVSRILPKASLKSCYAPAWMTCWDTKTTIKVGYPPRSLRGGRKKKTWSQPVGILSRRQNPICWASLSEFCSARRSFTQLLRSELYKEEKKTSIKVEVEEKKQLHLYMF